MTEIKQNLNFNNENVSISPFQNLECDDEENQQMEEIDDIDLYSNKTNSLLICKEPSLDNEGLENLDDIEN